MLSLKNKSKVAPYDGCHCVIWSGKINHLSVDGFRNYGKRGCKRVGQSVPNKGLGQRRLHGCCLCYCWHVKPIVVCLGYCLLTKQWMKPSIFY